VFVFGVRCSEHVNACSGSYSVPDTWCQVPDTWYLVPGTRYLVPGTLYLVPGTWYQVPSTRYPVSGTRYQALGTRYLVPEPLGKSECQILTKYDKIDKYMSEILRDVMFKNKNIKTAGMPTTSQRAAGGLGYRGGDNLVQGGV
jgi:hypothetical protein